MTHVWSFLLFCFSLVLEFVYLEDFLLFCFVFFQVIFFYIAHAQVRLELRGSTDPQIVAFQVVGAIRQEPTYRKSIF